MRVMQDQCDCLPHEIAPPGTDVDAATRPNVLGSFAIAVRGCHVEFQKGREAWARHPHGLRQTFNQEFAVHAGGHPADQGARKLGEARAAVDMFEIHFLRQMLHEVLGQGHRVGEPPLEGLRAFFAHQGVGIVTLG